MKKNYHLKNGQEENINKTKNIKEMIRFKILNEKNPPTDIMESVF